MRINHYQNCLASQDYCKEVAVINLNHLFHLFELWTKGLAEPHVKALNYIRGGLL